MRFLIDAQLPPQLALWLVGQGHDASHVFDHNLASAIDGTIWKLATATGAVLVTKDEDFVFLREQTDGGPAVVWLRIGNATNRVLLPWFAQRFPAIERALNAGEILVEVC
jgi:predicted nuclease of predicted toxin-antitoxin system